MIGYYGVGEELNNYHTFVENQDFLTTDQFVLSLMWMWKLEAETIGSGRAILTQVQDLNMKISYLKGIVSTITNSN